MSAAATAVADAGGGGGRWRRRRRRHFERWCMGYVFTVYIRFRENLHRPQSVTRCVCLDDMGTASANDETRGQKPDEREVNGRARA